MALNAFRAVLERLATRQLLGYSEKQEREAILAGARLRAAELGAEPLDVLQVNPEKTRCVLLCNHPRHGRCVLKVVSGQAPGGLAMAHVESLRRAHATGAAFLPALYELGTSYSLEQFVSGTTLHQLPREDWRDTDLVAFLATLRDFGVNDVPPEPIRSDECVLITFRFVRKVLRAADYAVRNVRPWHVSAFAFPTEKRRCLDRLLQEAARASLPRSLVFFDLTPANTIREASTGQLFVVDIEHMKEGFSGFDALWLLAMLTRSNACPVEVIEATYARVCSDAFTGASGGEPLMRAMFAFLLEVLGGYVGRSKGHRAIRHLQRRVEAAPLPMPESRSRGSIPAQPR